MDHTDSGVAITTPSASDGDGTTTKHAANHGFGVPLIAAVLTHQIHRATGDIGAVVDHQCVPTIRFNRTARGKKRNR
jgi:hypothetical protein